VTVSAPFADVEAELASETIAALANAVARTEQGREFAVIFDAQSDNPLDITVQRPIARALDAEVGDIATHDTILTIRTVRYKVVDLQPDGAGWTVLVLQETSS
jgi:hypothetical protein